MTDDELEDSRIHSLLPHDLPEYVRLFRIEGPLLFGATDKLKTVVEDVPSLPPIVVLRMRNMTALDATGLRAIEDVVDRLHRAPGARSPRHESPHRTLARTADAQGGILPRWRIPHASVCSKCWRRQVRRTCRPCPRVWTSSSRSSRSNWRSRPPAAS